jgi:hypothetical protein
MRTLADMNRDEADADDENESCLNALFVYRLDTISHRLLLDCGMLLVESDRNDRSHWLGTIYFDAR